MVSLRCKIFVSSAILIASSVVDLTPMTALSASQVFMCLNPCTILRVSIVSIDILTKLIAEIHVLVLFFLI